MHSVACGGGSRSCVASPWRVSRTFCLLHIRQEPFQEASSSGSRCANPSFWGFPTRVSLQSPFLILGKKLSYLPERCISWICRSSLCCSKTTSQQTSPWTSTAQAPPREMELLEFGQEGFTKEPSSEGNERWLGTEMREESSRREKAWEVDSAS